MKSPTTQSRLMNLIKSDIDAGKKVRCLDIDPTDQARLIAEITKQKGPLAQLVKKNGIDVALPSLSGVPLRWGATATRTQMKQ
jgi:hypothetical protein